MSSGIIRTIPHLFKRKKKELILDKFSDESFSAVKVWDCEEIVRGELVRVVVNFDKQSISYLGKDDTEALSDDVMMNVLCLFKYEEIAKFIRNTDGGSMTMFMRFVLVDEQPIFTLVDVYYGGFYVSAALLNVFAAAFGLKRAPFLGEMSSDQVIDYLRGKPISFINKSRMEGVVGRYIGHYDLHEKIMQITTKDLTKVNFKDH